MGKIEKLLQKTGILAGERESKEFDELDRKLDEQERQRNKWLTEDERELLGEIKKESA